MAWWSCHGQHGVLPSERRPRARCRSMRFKRVRKFMVCVLCRIRRIEIRACCMSIRPRRSSRSRSGGERRDTAGYPASARGAGQEGISERFVRGRFGRTFSIPGVPDGAFFSLHRLIRCRARFRMRISIPFRVGDEGNVWDEICSLLVWYGVIR
jgi:hypothetical protein